MKKIVTENVVRSRPNFIKVEHLDYPFLTSVGDVVGLSDGDLNEREAE